MPSFALEEEDRDAAASADGSSENEGDEMMKDADDVDADGDEDNQSVSSSGSQDADGPSRPHPSTQNPAVLLTSPSPRHSNSPASSGLPNRPTVCPEALNAVTYDIVPTIAAPQSTSINAVVATPDMRWVFSGGSDGYIRKFNWVETVNGKLMLTVAQRHPFVDSVTKAGVLLSYWENEEPSSGRGSTFQNGDDGSYLSPVYSLAVQSQGLWILSGLESGGISLQSVRHEEGKRIACLRKHTSAVSALNLAQDEKSILSGSWDKNIHDWDLNTGQVKRSFQASSGQISAIETRPISSLPVPEDNIDSFLPNGTFSTNTSFQANPRLSNTTNGGEAGLTNQDGIATGGSPANSLFGGSDADGDSLFGDHEEAPGSGPNGDSFADDDLDNAFSQAIANELKQQDEDAKAENTFANTDQLSGPVQLPVSTTTNGIGEDSSLHLTNGLHGGLSNGLSHADEIPSLSQHGPMSPESLPSSDTTFLAASIDGTIRIWDRRQRDPVVRILSKNAPPWCMNACWSPNGNYIYAGRRNGTVEEYSLHKGLREPERTFKFPQGSGPVSSVKAMPNGKHLICASFDILRLYDLREQQSKHSTVPFLIVPGHRTGVVSQLYMDPTCKFLISAGGNRGWEGASTEVMLGYEIGVLDS